MVHGRRSVKIEVENVIERQNMKPKCDIATLRAKEE
jgi:hypothetical protein